MRVLITGATGFIGLNLTNQLVNSDLEVVAFVRDESPIDRLPNETQTIKGDILDSDSLDRAMSNVDSVVHLAAVLEGPPEQVNEVNITGTKRVLEAAEKNDIEKIIYPSTIHAHPDIQSNDQSPYVKSKIEAERLFQRSVFGGDYSIIYPTYIFGPLDYRLSQASYFKEVLSNLVLSPPIYRHGKYNIVHVSDVVRTIEYTLANDDAAKRLIVSGDNISSARLYREIASIVDKRCHVVPVPFLLIRYFGVPVINYLHKLGHIPITGDRYGKRLDLGSVAEKYENRAPVSQRPLETALRDTYNWYKRVGLF